MKIFIRHILRTALTLAVSAAVSNVAAGQDYVSTPVEISKEKVRIDGKICYSHIVLEKQTLYSISKAYGISVDDIYRFNPTLKETGLKKNSIIIIPSQEALKSENAIQQPAVRNEMTEKKETVRKSLTATKFQI